MFRFHFIFFFFASKIEKVIMDVGICSLQFRFTCLFFCTLHRRYRITIHGPITSWIQWQQTWNGMDPFVAYCGSVFYHRFDIFHFWIDSMIALTNFDSTILINMLFLVFFYFFCWQGFNGISRLSSNRFTKLWRRKTTRNQKLCIPSSKKSKWMSILTQCRRAKRRNFTQKKTPWIYENV